MDPEAAIAVGARAMSTISVLVGRPFDSRAAAKAEVKRALQSEFAAVMEVVPENAGYKLQAFCSH